MQNVIQDHISKLETLPNELLTNVFEYMEPTGLKHGFWNLNHRLNGIINSSKIRLIMFRHFRNSVFENQDDIEVFNLFAPHLYSLRIFNFSSNNTHIDFSHCCQLRTLKIQELTEEYFTSIQSSVMPYLRCFATDKIMFNKNIFLEWLSNKRFPCLTTLELGEFKFKPKSEYKPILYIKSLSGLQCMWDNFHSIFTMFPRLRRLSVSLYTYRENPRWGSITPFTLALNNILLEFSSEMITPEDDTPFFLMINTSLRRIQFTASISKHNDNLVLLDVLPQILQRIENVIEQKTNEPPRIDDTDDSLEAALEAHLACQNITWCMYYMKNGWGWIDLESC